MEPVSKYKMKYSIGLSDVVFKTQVEISAR